MPPSTEALLETHYTGLNILLAVVHNTAATGRSHENCMQQWDFSSGIHKSTETDIHKCFFFPCITCGICNIPGITVSFIKLV